MPTTATTALGVAGPVVKDVTTQVMLLLPLEPTREPTIQEGADMYIRTDALMPDTRSTQSPRIMRHSRSLGTAPKGLIPNTSSSDARIMSKIST